MKKLFALLSLWLLSATFLFAEEDVVVEASTDAVISEPNKPFIGADFSLLQTMGPGTMFKKLETERSVTTELQIIPVFKTKPFWGERSLKASMEFYGTYEWMGKDGKAAAERISFNDTKFRLQLKNALSSKDLGLSFMPGLKIEIPSSSSSSIANRIIGIGSNLVFSFSKWGLTLSYKPTIIGYIHSLPYKSSVCGPESKEGDFLGGGQCRIAGGQTMMMVKNGLYAEYAYDAHSVVLGFKTFHGVLRPSDVPSAQKYTEATLGYVEYAYTLPFKPQTSINFGVSSFNSTYDARDGFKVPFFSEAKNASNFTNVYASLNLSI